MAVPNVLTGERYLALERAAETKSEFVDGAIVAMAGASYMHSVIVGNISFALRTALGKRCDVLTQDLKVLVDDRNYFYPDIVVICGKPEFVDGRKDVVTNPLAVFEVLSPSTEKRDRGKKRNRYRDHPNIQVIGLIGQEEIEVDVYYRQGESWINIGAVTAGSTLFVPPLACELNVDEIYEGVEFPPETTMMIEAREAAAAYPR